MRRVEGGYELHCEEHDCGVTHRIEGGRALIYPVGWGDTYPDCGGRLLCPKHLDEFRRREAEAEIVRLEFQGRASRPEKGDAGVARRIRDAARGGSVYI